MGLTRNQDWRGALSVYLDGQSRVPFEYGVSDCALFAAGAVAAMTGVDPAKDWRGKYTTLQGGLRIIRRAGYRDHVEATAAILTEIPVGRAGVGDVAMVPGDGGDALGIVLGEWIAVRTPAGVGHVPRECVERAFAC